MEFVIGLIITLIIIAGFVLAYITEEGGWVIMSLIISVFILLFAYELPNKIIPEEDTKIEQYIAQEPSLAMREDGTIVDVNTDICYIVLDYKQGLIMKETNCSK